MLFLLGLIGFRGLGFRGVGPYKGLFGCGDSVLKVCSLRILLTVLTQFRDPPNHEPHSLGFRVLGFRV